MIMVVTEMEKFITNKVITMLIVINKADIKLKIGFIIK